MCVCVCVTKLHDVALYLKYFTMFHQIHGSWKSRVSSGRILKRWNKQLAPCCILFWNVFSSMIINMICSMVIVPFGAYSGSCWLCIPLRVGKGELAACYLNITTVETGPKARESLVRI